MKRAAPIALFLILAALLLFAPRPARAGNPPIPPDIQDGIQKMYSGDPDAAIDSFRKFQTSDPQNPLGFLMEAEALTGKCIATPFPFATKCRTFGLDRGSPPTINTSPSPTKPSLSLSPPTLSTTSADMHLYAGLGWAVKARYFSMSNDHKAIARNGVKSREEFLKALHLDPEMSDAKTGLGLYNYYVDTLPDIVKLLRLIMGIPGGNKREGIEQLQAGINGKGITSEEARFYLAKNLRNYDHQYDLAAAVVSPLAKQFPQNPIFLLLLGNLSAEQGHKDEARNSFRVRPETPNPRPRLRKKRPANRQPLPQHSLVFLSQF